MIPTRARAYDTKPAPSGTISGKNLPTTKEAAPAGTRNGLTPQPEAPGRGSL